MGKEAKSSEELARLVREELGSDVDVDRMWIDADPELGWRVTCVGKPLTIGGFQYIADRIAERLRERYDLAAGDAADGKRSLAPRRLGGDTAGPATVARRDDSKSD
jgi:hypothetical protein